MVSAKSAIFLFNHYLLQHPYLLTLFGAMVSQYTCTVTMYSMYSVHIIINNNKVYLYNYYKVLYKGQAEDSRKQLSFIDAHNVYSIQIIYSMHVFL